MGTTSSCWCDTMSACWSSDVVLTGKMLADAIQIVTLTNGHAGTNTTTLSDMPDCMAARWCTHYRPSLTVTVAAFGPWQFCTPPVPPLVMTASSLHTSQASNHFPSFFQACSFNHARFFIHSCLFIYSLHMWLSLLYTSPKDAH